MVKSLNKRAASAALMLIVLLLTGCFGGAKTFTVVVQVTPELDGVEIHRGSETGDLLGTTNENGTVELRNVKSNTVLVPVKAGYRFNPASHPVSKAGKIEFTATPKERTVQSAASQADISVLIGTVFGDLPLPAEVEVALSDGSTVDLAVQWQEGTYDPDTAGEYSLEGVLVLTEGISNPDGINAEIRVIVRFVPEEDEPYYEEARSYLDQLIPEYVTEELNLPTRFEVASGAFFDAEWDSSHPDVLSPEGKVTPQIEDVEVTLTATLRLVKDAAVQAADDPRIWSRTVIVPADLIKVIDLILQELEEDDGPHHFSEVDDYNATFFFTALLIYFVEDPVQSYQFEQRLNSRMEAFFATLDEYAAAVRDWDPDVDSDEDLLNALEAFWDPDAGHLEFYTYLVPNSDITDVHDIQEQVIEKAQEIAQGWPVVKEIIDALQSGEEDEFREVLRKHSSLFQRLNLDDDPSHIVLSMYGLMIGSEAMETPYMTLAEMQDCLDAGNIAGFHNLAAFAFFNLDRDFWTMAQLQLPYLIEYQDTFGRQLDELDRLIKVFESETEEELYTALQDAGIEYVKVPLLAEYLKVFAGFAGASEASALQSPGELLERILALTIEVVDVFETALFDIKSQMQGRIHDVNLASVEAVLQKIGGVTRETPPQQLMTLLADLYRLTPILVKGEEIDFELYDLSLDFDSDRLPFYLEVLLEDGRSIEDIEDVKTAIRDGNAKYYAQFSEFAVTDVEAKVGEPLKFTLTVLDMQGNPCSALDDMNVHVSVYIEGGHWDSSPEVDITAGGIWMVATDIYYGEITEDVVAKLNIFVDNGEGYIYADELFTPPFLVDADVDRIDVVTEFEEYESMNSIVVTATLKYEANEKFRTVYTFSGTLPGQIRITDGQEDGYLEIYNRDFEFENGVAEVDVPAGKASSEDLWVEVFLPDLPVQSGRAVEPIKIVPGRPSWLAAEWVPADGGRTGCDIKIILQDLLGQTTTFEGQNMLVCAEPAPRDVVTMGVPGLDVPDRQGMAYVTFTGGEALIRFAGSPLEDQMKVWQDGYGPGAELDLLITVVDLGIFGELPYPKP